MIYCINFREPDRKPLQVLESAARKELSWIKLHGRPRYPFERAYRETFNYEKTDPRDHVKSLQDYTRLTPHLVPSQERLHWPIIRHPDLQPNNIFMSEDCNITGLIDWQHSVVLPTFLATGIPDTFQNYSDTGSLTFSPPKKPDFDGIDDEDERAAKLEEYRRRHVHFHYLGFTKELNDLHWQALQEDASLLRRRTYEDAGSPWEGLNSPLKTDIVRIIQNWPIVSLPDSDSQLQRCPISLSEEEMERRLKVEASLNEVDEDLDNIRGCLGISSDGWTSNENYENAKEKAMLIKEQGLASIKDDPWLKEMSERHWPLDDFDESE